MKLLGKKAIVTGANRSIGKSIAIAYAKEGADVVISYRTDEKGALETVKEIQKLGRSCKAIHADFSDKEEVEKFFTQALNFLNHVNILVNNAAGHDTKPFHDVSVDTFEYLLKVGVVAPMHLTQLATSHMIKETISGSIINISSISGIRPYPNRVAHSTAKAALNMLTQSTALELAKYNIRVNAIAPGATPYDESHTPSTGIRVGTPQDQAYGAVFLASDDSRWVTGQILTIDGGQSLSF